MEDPNAKLNKLLDEIEQNRPKETLLSKVVFYGIVVIFWLIIIGFLSGKIYITD